MFIRRWLIGIPQATVRTGGGRLAKVVALAALSSDAFSTVAYATEEMAHRGNRLAFSNGILLLGSFSCALIVIFRGSTHALIPLYAVGVSLSFTLSQAGMVRPWLVERGPHGHKNLLVNGLGAVATGLATGVLAVTKFTHGAWLVALLIPVLILCFRTVHGRAGATRDQLSLARHHRPLLPKHITGIVPISHANRAAIPVPDYARSLGSDIRAVSVDLGPEETAQMKAQGEAWGDSREGPRRVGHGRPA